MTLNGSNKLRDMSPGCEWRETEFRSPRFEGLETWPNREILGALLGGQHQALNAVAQALPQLESAIDAAVARLSGEKGRIIYVGAGTSGRLAVLDGIELTPTFGWPLERLEYLFAGGDAGLNHAIEGAEDDAVAGQSEMEAIKPTPQDVVLGLAASGTTPYTRAAIHVAREAGSLTIAFANNPGSPLISDAEFGVLLATGAEVLSGSTRLGAGTSQKIALNLFSTTLMIGLNKVHRGHMVDMQASNEKLILRAQRMVIEITGCDLVTATAALEQCDYHTKLAVLIVEGQEKNAALSLLRRHKGNLAAALSDK
ncbi:MAG: N-acetylmuramic acid 6-phosphate etherase [Devosiaceae bacterium]|nr:N-acetylmuramic acid 6-phosphate etherase [Devosiaceae bacterium]